MAISRLSSPVENWVEIGTSSPTSGSVVTFSSLANYRKFRLVGFDVNLSTSASLKITFNNDTGNNYAYSYVRLASANVTDSLTFAANTVHSFDFEIDFNSQSTWKRVIGWAANTSSVSDYWGLWKDTASITEIDLTTSTGTYSSGTIKLYGTN